MEEDIKILEKYTEKDIPCDSCRYCGERPNVTKAVRNLIVRYKELEKEKLSKSGIYKIDINLKENYIPKSKVQEKIEHRIKKLEKMQEEDTKFDDRYYDEYDYEMTLLKSIERELIED